MSVTQVRLGAPKPTVTETPPAVLDPNGPRVVLGGVDPLQGSVAPSASALFGPRAATLLSDHGPLWIADTGHHRLLGYPDRPKRDNEAAAWVLGQPDFESEGRNALGPASALTMNVPVGVIAWPGGGLAVADSWNNRVLVWKRAPESSGVPADFVLGQLDFEGQEPNHGGRSARADSMHWPFALLVYRDRLYVADAGNRRILGWRSLPVRSGQPADFVLGQSDLDQRSDNGGEETGPHGMRWPHALTVVGECLAMSDAGNNRILVWDGVPDCSRVAATTLVGQPDFLHSDHNRGAYWPDASALNMPYGMASDGESLFISDTANSRILRFDPPFSASSGATALTGQVGFDRKGDNRWNMPVRDSLCWPYGISLSGSVAVVADTGNHRIALWDIARS